MNEIFQWIVEEIQTNDMLTGLVGGSLMASFLYVMRGVPGRIWSGIQSATTSTMTLNSEKNRNFNEALFLFRNLRPLIRHKHFSMVYLSGDDEELDSEDVALGYGTHFFMLYGVLCKVALQSNDEGMRFRENLEIVALTRNGTKFFNRLNKDIHKRKVETRHVYEYSGWWRKINGSQQRSMDSVALPRNQKSRVCGAVSSFLASKEWYIERGIPWRLSMLFEGVPGTGKTSLAIAVSTEFNLPLYYLSLSSLESDADLFDAMRSVPSRSVVVIEDIDCAFDSVNKRKPVDKTPSALESTEKPEQPNNAAPITLSGLLNSIDGILAPQGRILIMTTNHAEKLDEALLRPGRVDIREVLEGSEASNIELYTRISGRSDIPEKIKTMTPAEVQGEAIESRVAA